MDKHTRQNRKLWDTWTKLHRASGFYDVDAFKAGATSLKPVEVEELGDVTGKRLLHLQCHFGMDTLSWARAGAHVTGVDLSGEAIDTARALADELDIPAEFVCADVLAPPPELSDREFDIVFTSYGVIPWLSSLERWGEVIAARLAPGGVFYMVEFHPVGTMLDDTGTRFEFDYFPGDEPAAYTQRGSYAAPDADVETTAFEWSHTVGDVVTALAAAGLVIEFVHEFPYSVYDCYPFLEPAPEPGRYVVKNTEVTLPLMFSVRAHAPAR